MAIYLGLLAGDGGDTGNKAAEIEPPGLEESQSGIIPSTELKEPHRKCRYWQT